MEKKEPEKLVDVEPDVLDSDEEEIDLYVEKEPHICCLYRLLRLLKGGYRDVRQVEIDVSEYPKAPCV